MCGIHVVVSHNSSFDTTTPPAHLKQGLINRGPDYFGQVTTRLEAATAPVFLTFTSTVLALRGDHVTKQPFQDAQTGSVLCWNGEAWRINGQPVEGNDGEAIFALLSVASKKSSETRSRDPILDVFRSIQAITGPFAFVYFDGPSETVYFGRDRLGRRSLLICRDESNGSFVLSSMAEACQATWMEVNSDGVYSVVLRQDADSKHIPLPVRHYWLPPVSSEFVSEVETDEEYVLGLARFNGGIPREDAPALCRESEAVHSLHRLLSSCVKTRVMNIPEPPITGVAPDTRVAVLFSGGLDCTVLARLCHDSLPKDQAVDLLNVAFENPRVAAQLHKEAKGAAVDVYEACPDRITGRKAFAELQRACPGRVFRFVAVNVPYKETCEHRAQVISLIYPHNTEMDLSIAYALYFAARGQGMCYKSGDSTSEPVPYTSPARVLLSGLGADELFGGYGRHYVGYQRAGYAGLIGELKLDVSRLGKRNLGRDDRVMAHWSKEVRFPYLDEQLVLWAIKTSVWDKCDFRNDEDMSGVEPGKRVLRLVALELGLEQVAREKKRAIQFGARTAKMESGRVKGTMVISSEVSPTAM